MRQAGKFDFLSEKGGDYFEPNEKNASVYSRLTMLCFFISAFLFRQRSGKKPRRIPGRFPNWLMQKRSACSRISTIRIFTAPYPPEKANYLIFQVGEKLKSLGYQEKTAFQNIRCDGDERQLYFPFVSGADAF